MSSLVDSPDADAGPAPRGSSNIRSLARMEIDGGGQVVVQGDYAFIGHQHGPLGTSILDIADPRRPRIISTLYPPNGAHSHKVRVVGDIMICNSERQDPEFDSPGFRIFDVSDKANPKLITFMRTYGKGVHRFDVDERYAYISTEMEGFVGNILVIYDIADPAKPREVSRLWVEGQNVAGGEQPHPLGARQRLHHGLRCGDEIYMGYWHAGVAIGDLTDIEHPKLVAHYRFDPPTVEPMHTFMKIPHAVAGMRIALSTEEERSQRGPDVGKPHGPFRVWNADDPKNPKILAEYHVPESASPYHGPNVRFGAHQFRERIDEDNICYVTWFAAGLRILDVNDPRRPKEIGYFIPKPGDGCSQPFTNDVTMDHRGLLYVTDKARGLDVIEIR